MMAWQPISLPLNERRDIQGFHCALTRECSEDDARNGPEARFILGENGTFYELALPGRVPGSAEGFELSLYEVIRQDKRRAKAGHGWREFDVVRFHDALPKLVPEEHRLWEAHTEKANADRTAYVADLSDRISQLLDAYKIQPTEDGWRTLAMITTAEARRLGYHPSDRENGMPWRSYALRLAVHLATGARGPLSESFHAFRLAPVPPQNTTDDENYARDRWLEAFVAKANERGEIDPKGFEHLLDELIGGGWISDRTLGEVRQNPEDDTRASHPREFVYRDKERRTWPASALQREGPLRAAAARSLKAGYQERKREGRIMTRSMWETLYRERILNDLEAVALRIEKQRLR
jgi:hypothetical protein